MNYELMIFILQSDYEAWGLKSVLIAGMIGLATTVGYLYKSKETALKEQRQEFQKIIETKDNQILAVLKEHNADMKDGANDYKALVEKYNTFTHQIKEIANGRGVTK